MPSNVKTTLGDVSLFRFDSPLLFAQAANTLPSDRKYCDAGWCGENWTDATANAERGNDRHVKAAEKIIEQVFLGVETVRQQWVPSVAGAFPIVPEFLAGYNECMRRSVPVASDRGPICIYVDLTSSCSIQPEVLSKRGTAYVALAMAFAAVRPVELHALITLGDRGSTVIDIKLATDPIDLSVVCNAFTSGGLVRGLGYTFASEKCGADGRFLKNLPPKDDNNRRKSVSLLREVLGASDADIIAPSAYGADPAIHDPIAFVKRALSEHGGEA